MKMNGPEMAGAGHLGNLNKDGEELGQCPGCGALIGKATATHPETKKVIDVMTHPLPFCHYFGITEPTDIVKEMLSRAGKN